MAPEAWAVWRKRAWALIRANWDGSRTVRAYACPPPGVALADAAAVTACRRRTCVFCHARQVGRAYRILAAAPRRPLSAWAVFRTPGFRPASFRRTLTRHAHFAYTWLRPKPRGKGLTWEQVGVALVDAGRPAWRAVVRRYSSAGPVELAEACLAAFRYPSDWRDAAVRVLGRLERSHEHGGRYWAGYGLNRPAGHDHPGVVEVGPDAVGAH
jgi:hypothetical protein